MRPTLIDDALKDPATHLLRYLKRLRLNGKDPHNLLAIFDPFTSRTSHDIHLHDSHACGPPTCLGMFTVCFSRGVCCRTAK